jgi:hypothetical protein
MLPIASRLRGELGGRAERQMKVVEVEFRPEAESITFLLGKDFFHTGKRCLIVQLKVRRLVSAVKKD